MDSSVLSERFQVLQQAIRAPNIRCGIGHETNPPHQACVLGETPRHRIGCMHSDLPLILSQLLEEFMGKGHDADVTAFQERLCALRQRFASLDNLVYEGELLDLSQRKERQDDLAKALRTFIEDFLEFCATLPACDQLL